MASEPPVQGASAGPLLGGRSTSSSFAGQLWSAHQYEAKFALLSPLALCLGTGDPDMDNFKHFIFQESHMFKTICNA